MATEYSFEMGKPAIVDEVAGVFTRVAVDHGLTGEDGAAFRRPGRDLRSGVLVSVAASSALPFPDPVAEQFGFAPTVDVLFRFDKIADPIAQRHDMIRLVVAALAEVSGDALLAFGGEIARLLRRDGRLTISEASDFWIPEVVALLPPHDRASLPTF